MGDVYHVANLAERASKSNPSNSLSGLISTLIPILLFQFLPFIVLFLILRSRSMRIYQPRTYLGGFHDYEKTPTPSQTMFGWVKDFWALPDTYVMNHQSIDGYLFLRFFKIMCIITFVGCLITWPILFPVNATGSAGGQQFDLLAIQNNGSNPNRYYAHNFVAWIFLGFVMFIIAREQMFYVHLRQAYLLSPFMASRMASRTVVFTDVPEDYLDEARLRATFPFIKHVWIMTDTKELQKMVKERDTVAMKLEGAEVSLSKAANDKRLKAKKKGGDADAENPMQWAYENKRPQHRLKTAVPCLKPCMGTKVDTLDWCREQLQQLIPQVEQEQAKHYNGQASKIPAVIIEFENIQAAESAYQQIPYHTPKIMQPRAIGVHPNEIIWSNLSMPWWRRDAMYVAATAIVTVMIIFWGPITAFAGAVANINKLDSLSFLTWIKDIPPVILGVVTGLLPVIIVIVIMMLPPILLHIFSKMTGVVSIGEMELQVMGWYFWFQVVQVFLVVTISSAAAGAADTIVQDPSKAISLLQENIPKASNFYINYFVANGLLICASVLANIVAFALFIILGNILDKTPRKKYARYVNVPGLTWGSTYPKFTLLAVIALTYSIIAPLILGFAFVTFFAIYFGFRYCLLYTLDTTNISTQGATYPKALGQITVGVYISLICLIGLFGINAANGGAGAGPLILIIIFTIAVILFHIALNNALKPLISNLPRDLLVESTRKLGHDIQQGSEGSEYHSALGQSEGTMGDGKLEAQTSTQPVLKTAPQLKGYKKWMYWLLHPTSLPEFASHLSQPLPDYPEEIRREAYLDASVTSPAPLLWIPHDEMGISAREREETGKVIGITDEGAWWDETSGKLRTIWMDEEKRGEKNMAAQAPVHEKKIDY